MSTQTKPSFETACRQASWPASVELKYPGTEAFTKATARWNAYGSPSYCAVVSPTSKEEVVSIVKVANAANIPFLATGGRHQYGTTVQKLQNGLAIDLSRFSAVTVDKESATVTVGGGVRIRDVLRVVSEAGFQIPSGNCSSTGYIGSCLGAGIGFLEGTFGLVIDCLQSADMITANGDLLEVSETSHPDLFWAIRGAGTNFGIVTSAVFKVFPMVNNGQVFYADMVYSKSQKTEFFDMIQTFDDDMPSQLGFAASSIWDSELKETKIIATIIYVGTEQEARQRLACFFDIRSIYCTSKMIPYNEIPKYICLGIPEEWCDVTGGIHDIHTLNVRQLSGATYASVFDKFDAFLQEHPEGRSSALLFEMFANQTTLKVPDENTAYPWRDARGNFMIDMQWAGLDNPYGDVANVFAKELRADLVATSGYPELSAYVSYAYGDETLEQKFGRQKLPRLVELKKKWDPNNVFGFCNPLPTEL